MKGYDKKGSYEGMSTWQLLQKVFVGILTESKSITTLVTVMSEKKGAEKTALYGAVLKSNQRIRELVRFLDSLLAEQDEFSKNMASLYDWYLENLDIVTDSASTLENVQVASANLITQAEGFLDIWSTVKSGK